MQRKKISIVQDAIQEPEGKIGKNIPITDLTTLAEEKGVNADDVETAIEKLKRSGNIFEPRRGFISRL